MFTIFGGINTIITMDYLIKYAETADYYAGEILLVVLGFIFLFTLAKWQLNRAEKIIREEKKKFVREL